MEQTLINVLSFKTNSESFETRAFVGSISVVSDVSSVGQSVADKVVVTVTPPAQSIATSVKALVNFQIILCTTRPVNKQLAVIHY